MSLTLTPIESGRLTSAKGVLCEHAEGDITIPVSCWVVSHPKGTVLFDTGLHKELTTDSGRLGASADVFAVDIPAGEDLVALLSQKEFDAGKIDFIVLSHLHFDHCGGTEQIPNARIIVQEEEWLSGTDPKLIELGIYNPNDFNLGHSVKQIKGEFDLFGDGTVVCLPTPGHTAGHQSLRIELESGPVVLTSDCVYWQQMLEDMSFPPFGFSREQHRDSMLNLIKLQKEGCKLIFGHDALQWASLKDNVLR